MGWALPDLKCPFCHDPINIKLADDAPSEPFEPWPGFVAYPETHIQCWFCKQFIVLVKDQSDEFKMANIRHAEVRAQYDRAVEKIYDQMAEVEQKLEGQWGTEKQRESAETKIEALEGKLESGWGTEAQREKAQAQIVELQAKLDAPWGTEAQREAAALKLEKLEEKLQDRQNGFDNQRGKFEDRMEKVQARREAKYGTAAVVGAIAKGVLSGGKKSGCILPVLVLSLMLLLVAGAFASPEDSDTTQADTTGVVVVSAADVLPDKEVLAEVKPVAADTLPEVNTLGDGGAGNNQSGWPGINASIVFFNLWRGILVAIGGVFLWFFNRWRKKRNRPWPNQLEQGVYDSLLEIQGFAKRKDSKNMATYVNENYRNFQLFTSPHTGKISRQWNHILDRMAGLNNQKIKLTENERKQKWKEINALIKSALRILESNLNF